MTLPVYRLRLITNEVKAFSFTPMTSGMGEPTDVPKTS